MPDTLTLYKRRGGTDRVDRKDLAATQFRDADAYAEAVDFWYAEGWVDTHSEANAVNP